MLSNDNTSLVPNTNHTNHLLEFDFPAMQIGAAEYAEGPTGCTVFHFPNGASTAVDTRGGSAGTIGNFSWNHAICLAGGSLYGLEAAAGVSAELLAMRGYAKNWFDIALVSGAIMYDFGPRDNAIYPDKPLGRAALRAARAGVFPIGRVGAGSAVTAGKGFDYTMGEFSGQGGAFRQYGATKVAAFSVVNAIGAIVNRAGKVVLGHLDKQSGERVHIMQDVERRLAASAPTATAPGNTTLTVIVTNQKINAGALNQLAKQVHDSMARVIQPFHTSNDGDTLYAVTTNEVENTQINEVALGVIASETVWDAVLSIADAV